MTDLGIVGSLMRVRQVMPGLNRRDPSRGKMYMGETGLVLEQKMNNILLLMPDQNIVYFHLDELAELS